VRGVEVGRRLARAVQTLVPPVRSGVVIVCYHLIDAGTESPVDLAGAVFEEQIAHMARIGRIVPVAEALAALEQRERDDLLFVLTFDDAYENFYTSVWPSLEARGVHATLCVPTGFVNGTSSAPTITGVPLRPASWSMLREMVTGSHVSIASHTVSHPDLRAVSDQQLDTELADSRAELESRLQCDVSTFCYPRGHWSPRVEAAVAEHYATAFVGGGWTLTPANWHPLRLWRTSMRQTGPDVREMDPPRRVELEEYFADLWRRRLR